MEDKIRLYQPWLHSMIVNVYGKTVGFEYISSILKDIWKMSEDLHIIDLGRYLFLIKLKKVENFHRALHEGPWSIGKFFLTVRRWESKFSTSQVVLPSTAIWVRLQKLPFEFYDLTLLKHVGKILGILLKIDASTFDKKRAKLLDYVYKLN